MSQSVMKRVTGYAIAGTVSEFDELARALSSRCETTAEPRWELSHPEVQGFTVKGRLADAKGLGLARTRKLTLWLGDYGADRRVTLTADAFGVRADVWGETTEWVKDSAAIVQGRMRGMRPWWWFLRTPLGAALLCLVINLVILAAYAALSRVADSETWTGASWVAVGFGILGGVLTATFAAPSIRIGPRVGKGAVLTRLGLFLLASVVAALISVAVTWLIVGTPA